MAIFKLRRRAAGGAAGAPATLKTTEPAYNETDDTLYIGYGDDGSGNSTSVRAVAGAGAFCGIEGAQTINGLKTFTLSPIVPTKANGDNSTAAASTAFVKNQGYITQNQTITVSGDATGSGTSAITLTLANSGVTAGTYPKVTVNAKGLVTGGSGLLATDIPTLTSAKISDFDAEVRSARLDEMAAPTADVSFNSRRITGLSDPAAAQDAATKAYVDSVSQGLDAKGSVVAATTANITLSGTQTIDGIAVAVGDRVLVRSQTTANQNGIYIAAAGAWSRATDADSWSELVSAFTFVEGGTSNANSGWVCTVAAGGTLGTTNVTWVQFSGAGQVVAGNGLTKTGNTLDVVGTANRITVAADSIDIASTYVGQTSITTLGTVATGTWSATAIAATKGGTGLTSAISGLMKGNGAAYSAAVAGTDYLDPSSTIDGGTF